MSLRCKKDVSRAMSSLFEGRICVVYNKKRQALSIA